MGSTMSQQIEIEARSRAQIELITIYEISKILSSSLDLSMTFRESMNVLATMMGFRRGMVVLYSEESKRLELFCSIGMLKEEQMLCTYKPGEGVVGRIFSMGVPVVVPDISDEPLFLNRTKAVEEAGLQKVGFVGVPIKGPKETLGVLTIDRVMAKAGGFKDDHRLLTMIANLMAQSLVLHRNVTEDRDHLLSEARRLKQQPKGRFSLDKVVGDSRRMQEVFAEVHQVGPTRSTVLLRGESGTGKEVIARAIHELSPRSGAPFIKVNCAALTESLLESELFGHEKGSFTGAIGERKGRFELAHGGTLFLDEIGDISPSFQAKMLRVLQEREFERVGGNKPIKVDVRLVCATNRNLEKMVAAGNFRADLYYRINVVSVFLPSLRERREDIPALVMHFLQRYNKENLRDLKVAPEALSMLENCYWPGNVRELENCVERIATMTVGNVIHDINFPCFNDRCLTQTLHHLQKDDAVAPARQLTSEEEHSEHHHHHEEVSVISPPIKRSAAAANNFGDEKPEGERERLVWAMERSGWVQAKAARLLNITPRQMGYALQKYEIEVRKF